jgi:hypothetical protein
LVCAKLCHSFICTPVFAFSGASLGVHYFILSFDHAGHGIAFSSLTGIAGGFINLMILYAAFEVHSYLGLGPLLRFLFNFYGRSFKDGIRWILLNRAVRNLAFPNSFDVKMTKKLFQHLSRQVVDFFDFAVKKIRGSSFVFPTGCAVPESGNGFLRSKKPRVPGPRFCCAKSRAL